MHVLIINGSPRIKKFSNTDMILQKFTEGMCENGDTFDLYEISDKDSWDSIRKAYDESDNILIALPLYVECIPGLLMEFLETLTPKTDLRRACNSDAERHISKSLRGISDANTAEHLSKAEILR